MTDVVEDGLFRRLEIDLAISSRRAATRGGSAGSYAATRPPGCRAGSAFGSLDGFLRGLDAEPSDVREQGISDEGIFPVMVGEAGDLDHPTLAFGHLAVVFGWTNVSPIAILDGRFPERCQVVAEAAIDCLDMELHEIVDTGRQRIHFLDIVRRRLEAFLDPPLIFFVGVLSAHRDGVLDERFPRVLPVELSRERRKGGPIGLGDALTEETLETNPVLLLGLTSDDGLDGDLFLGGVGFGFIERPLHRGCFGLGRVGPLDRGFNVRIVVRSLVKEIAQSSSSQRQKQQARGGDGPGFFARTSRSMRISPGSRFVTSLALCKPCRDRP